MKVRRVHLDSGNDVSYELLDDEGRPIEVVSGFMRHLRARGYSPNTLSAYMYDLLHFTTFLKEHQLSYQDFTPARAWSFLEYLRTTPSRNRAQRLSLVLCTTEQGRSTTQLSPTTINRILASVSSFYEYLIVSDQFADRENPIRTVDDPTALTIPERHQPFMGHASRQRPIRRAVRMKTAQRVPRPMSEDQVTKLLDSLRFKRDKAMILLMLHGGLRPGDYIG